ncbi:MAG: zinc ribbon domain-containing protein [Lentimicrobiaceae bacterium]|nr:zinc ribbon domain-containing protein [Lentimicrobiaceae bacterium]
MSDLQQQVQQQTQQKTAVKTQSVTQQSLQCPNCGAAISSADTFCAECGMRVNTNSCGKCGAEVGSQQEICLECGNNLHAEQCSFCGSNVSAADTFCPECGNSRGGIVCPNCNALNFRNFCRKCNTPLNALAQEALEEARKDVRLQKTIEIAQELENLEEIIRQFEEEAEEPETFELSEENKKNIERYNELMALTGGVEAKNVSPAPKAPPTVQTEKTSKKLNFSNVTIPSKEDAIKLYQQKMQEMQDSLNSMMPPADAPPQVQRDYLTARKMEFLSRVRTKVTIGWKCNWASYVHADPNECGDPFKGGVWLFKDEFRTEKVTV